MSRLLRQLWSGFVVAGLLVALVLVPTALANADSTSVVQRASLQTTMLQTDNPASDADFDYWSQIVQHRIPEIKDGAVKSFPGGKYYFGQNGLEVRLTNNASQLVIAAAGGTGGYIVGADAAALLASTTPMVTTVVQLIHPGVWAVLRSVAGTSAGFVLPGNQCLGFTLPPAWVGHYLNNDLENIQALANGQIPFGFGYNVPVWLEQCS